MIGTPIGVPTEPSLPTSKLQDLTINPTKQIEDTIDLTKQYHNLLERREDNTTTAYTWDSNVLHAVGSGAGERTEKTDVNTYNTYQYLQDELGSPIRVLSEDNVEQEVYGYDEFGVETINSNNQGQNQTSINFMQPFTYTGYQKDNVANTYFAQAREYTPIVGRFSGEDVIKGSIVRPLTINHYVYCLSSPMGLVDLDGRQGKNPDELIVFIDPGHGGDDKGAMGAVRPPIKPFLGPDIPVTYYEKDANLQLALKVKEGLEEQGVTVHMSRTTDVEISLENRAEMANKSGADLFVSIHHNSSNPFKQGTSILYPRIERHGERGETSKNIAQIINDLVSENTRLRNRELEEGDLKVLNLTNMLAILTETGYMGGDLFKILNEEHMQAVADNIVIGIIQSLKEGCIK